MLFFQSCPTCCPYGSGPACSCAPCECFPSDAKVSLENGISVKMSALKVGDKVQTGMSNMY